MRFENLNAFTAQMCAATPGTSSMYWPLILLDLAWPGLQGGNTIYHIRVACLWYIYAADEIWAAVLDKEKKYFTREIWDKYKERLLDSQVRLKNLKARKLIDEAIIQLKRAEGSG